MIIKPITKPFLPLFILCWMLFTLTALAFESPIAEIMDKLVAALCEGRAYEALSALDDAAILAALTPEQREALSTQYWSFDVNVPVVVSVMRDVEQSVPPFWLADRGFTKTDMIVKNENYTYEVWQKNMPSGRVGLGINGFDRHRPHYFVGVGPQQKNDALMVSNVTPGEQEIYPFDLGTVIYHDWSELVVTEMPDALKGHVLLPTIRGRAREAQLIGAFRQTPHTSSDNPDMVVLTWSDTPTTTQTIQWRVNAAEDTVYQVGYRIHGSDPDAPWTYIAASSKLLTDRNIFNDNTVRWYTATLAGLSPATVYEYAIVAVGEKPEAPMATFRTAPDKKAPLTFLWMSDTHNNPASIPLLKKTWELHPETAFLTISGDLVGTGQQRDDWDSLFSNYKEFLQQVPLAPSIGNHDAIDGLGSDLYRSLMLLPDNGPKEFYRGQSYTLRYGALLLVSLDVTDDVAVQSPWLEGVLRDTDALWKVAVLHFPPYAQDRDYADIEQEWCTLFDRYHVDLALSGHVHDYMRTFPLRAGTRVDSPADGTIYLVSVAVPGRARPGIKPDYAEVMDLSGVPTCTAFTIDDSRLTMRVYEKDGSVRDSFTIEKNE